MGGRKEVEYIFKCFANGNILSHGFPAHFLFALRDITAVFRMGGESLWRLSWLMRSMTKQRWM